MTLELTFAAATADRWADVERLFGVRGACGGCWCMYWRLPRPVYEQGKGEGNRIAFRATIEAGEEPGVIAYDDGEPIGWCAVGPRETYPVLGRSRVLKPIDDEEVWSITCFFVARPYRGRGVTVALLAAAVEFARERGTRIVEGIRLRRGRRGCRMRLPGRGWCRRLCRRGLSRSRGGLRRGRSCGTWLGRRSRREHPWAVIPSLPGISFRFVAYAHLERFAE